MIILGTESVKFKSWHDQQEITKNNGSYWYSKEIEEIILPKLPFDLLFVTSGATLYKNYEIPDHSVVICHDNRSTRRSYMHLFRKNILWICSKHSTVSVLETCGEKAVYVPLSIDTEYVSTFKTKKTKDIAFVGNYWSFKKKYLESLPKNIDQVTGLPREKLLKKIAKYKRVIAEGRCLMEAQVLGCKCEVPKYENGLESVFVDVLDSREAVALWHEALIDYSQTMNEKCILRSIKSFNDLEAKRYRRFNEIFLTTKERAEELLANEFKIVEAYNGI